MSNIERNYSSSNGTIPDFKSRDGHLRSGPTTVAERPRNNVDKFTYMELAVACASRFEGGISRNITFYQPSRDDKQTKRLEFILGELRIDMQILFETNCLTRSQASNGSTALLDIRDQIVQTDEIAESGCECDSSCDIGHLKANISNMKELNERLGIVPDSGSLGKEERWEEELLRLRQENDKLKCENNQQRQTIESFYREIEKKNQLLTAAKMLLDEKMKTPAIVNSHESLRENSISAICKQCDEMTNFLSHNISEQNRLSLENNQLTTRILACEAWIRLLDDKFQLNIKSGDQCEKTIDKIHSQIKQVQSECERPTKDDELEAIHSTLQHKGECLTSDSNQDVAINSIKNGIWLPSKRVNDDMNCVNNTLTASKDELTVPCSISKEGDFEQKTNTLTYGCIKKHNPLTEKKPSVRGSNCEQLEPIICRDGDEKALLNIGTFTKPKINQFLSSVANSNKAVIYENEASTSYGDPTPIHHFKNVISLENIQTTKTKHEVSIPSTSPVGKKKNQPETYELKLIDDCSQKDPKMEQHLSERNIQKNSEEFRKSQTNQLSNNIESGTFGTSGTIKNMIARKRDNIVREPSLDTKSKPKNMVISRGQGSANVSKKQPNHEEHNRNAIGRTIHHQHIASYHGATPPAVVMDYRENVIKSGSIALTNSKPQKRNLLPISLDDSCENPSIQVEKPATDIGIPTITVDTKPHYAALPVPKKNKHIGNAMQLNKTGSEQLDCSNASQHILIRVVHADDENCSKSSDNVDQNSSVVRALKLDNLGHLISEHNSFDVFSQDDYKFQMDKKRSCSVTKHDLQERLLQNKHFRAKVEKTEEGSSYCIS